MRRGAYTILSAALIAAIGTSQAATLGTLTERSLGAGTVSNPALCTAGAVSVTDQVGFRGGRYEIYQLTFSGIPAACQGKPFVAQIADPATNAALGTVTGALPGAAGGSVALPAGTGPNINDVGSSLRVVLYVTG